MDDTSNEQSPLKVCCADPLMIIPMGPLLPQAAGIQALTTFTMCIHDSMFKAKAFFVPAVSQRCTKLNIRFVKGNGELLLVMLAMLLRSSLAHSLACVLSLS